jgi:RTX calcium-binding nonapeptide repeat (4 copies)
MMRRNKSGIRSTRTRFLWGVVAISALAAFVALPAGSALAKRIVGTSGPDKIVGTNKADRINARAGNDRVNGRGGNDRLKGSKGRDRLAGGKGRDKLDGSAGKDRIRGAKGKDRMGGNKGADRLNAVDGKRDRAVHGGPGKDVCTIDQADLPVLRSCERAKVRHVGGGGGGGGGGGLRVKSASGLVCGSVLPLCPFQIVGDHANSLVGLVSGGGGVNLAAGAAVAITGDTWTAAGLYGCSANGHLTVTIGSRSVRVPITCT